MKDFNTVITNIKRVRKNKGISLNKMSNDLYGNRYYVNYLSNIEKGKIQNVSYVTVLKIVDYLKIAEKE